jgi:hypothetical protein
MLLDIHYKAKVNCIRTIEAIIIKAPYMMSEAIKQGQDLDELFKCVKDDDPELVIATVELWQQILTDDIIVMNDAFLENALTK